ncbi:kinetochore-associated Ndc80 complex subunit spc25 [Thoreauomyces humboldtii]|nr:kinetochore-associated Ndc80 complex subunit spc25 [Thoreauomyces humboldtii]
MAGSVSILSKGIARMSLAPSAFPSGSLPPATPGHHRTARSHQHAGSAPGVGSSSEAVNPQITEISAQCASFVTNFDAWVASSRRELQETKRTHIKTTGELREERIRVEAQIEACKNKQSDLQRLHEKERQEAENLEAEVVELKSQKVDRDLTREELVNRIKDRRQEIRRRREELARKAEALQARQNKLNPELQCYMDKLAMTVNSVEQDVLEFVFTHINSAHWNEEYRFTLDIRRSRYEVTECEPPISDLDKLVDFVNGSRKEFYTFLKLMRRSFTQTAKQNKG